MFDHDGNCDESKYTIFTNAVKFTSWVKKITSEGFSSQKIEYVTVDEVTGKKVEAHSGQTFFYTLNGTIAGQGSCCMLVPVD